MPSTPDFVSVERDLGLRGSLHDFVRMAWPIVEPGSEFQDNWHIEVVSEHLEAVTRREIRKLVINIPPSFMKSLLVQVFWPTWKWIRDPGNRQISASYDIKLTTRDARKTLSVLTSPWFIERWGDRVALPRDVAVTDFTNTAGGFRYSTSVKGPMTGRHCDDFVVDDPVKPLTISATTLEECNRWWHETTPTRFRDFKNSAKVIIMQRLHEGDLTGEVLREDGWYHLCLPMRYEKNRTTSALKYDPRIDDGELLWPGRMPEEEVRLLETDLGSRGTAAQLQQRPAPAEGAIFKSAWFHHYREPPARFDMMIQSWDCAFKDEETSDYVCGQVWGMKGAEFYLLDMVKARLDMPETCAAIEKMTRKWPKAIAKLVEDKANGPAVIQTLKKKITGLTEVQPEGGKVARANAVAPMYEAGNIFHPDPEVWPWVDDFETSMTTFPFGKNDDDVDATTQALNWLHGKTANYAKAMENAPKFFMGM